MSQSNTYGRAEKLKSRKLIDEIFQNGSVVKSYPIRIHYISGDLELDHNLKVGVSVSKRNFKKAVDRNRVKRLLREAYRLNKGEISKVTSQDDCQLAMLIIYGDRILPTYDYLERRLLKCLIKIIQELKNV